MQQFEKTNTNKKDKERLLTKNSIIYSTAMSMYAAKYFITKSLLKTTLLSTSITSLDWVFIIKR